MTMQWCYNDSILELVYTWSCRKPQIVGWINDESYIATAKNTEDTTLPGKATILPFPIALIPASLESTCARWWVICFNLVNHFAKRSASVHSDPIRVASTSGLTCRDPFWGFPTKRAPSALFRFAILDKAIIAASHVRTGAGQLDTELLTTRIEEINNKNCQLIYTIYSWSDSHLSPIEGVSYIHEIFGKVTLRWPGVRSLPLWMAKLLVLPNPHAHASAGENYGISVRKRPRKKTLGNLTGFFFIGKDRKSRKLFFF